MLLVALIHLTAVLYILMIVFNALGGIGYQGRIFIFFFFSKYIGFFQLRNPTLTLTGLFTQSVGQVSDIYTVYITPAGFTFTIWSVIYIFLGAGAIYCE